MAPLTRPLRIGTDCSGMEAPIQALDNLGVKYDHIFSCDIDKSAKATIEANFPAKHWYDDLTKRDNTTAPKVDLYVAGFPCQPFSACGLKQGFKDKKGRGTILFDICDYLEEQRPRVFVLENVVHILRVNGGRTWEAVMETLNSVGGGAYRVTWDKMNTKEHGVPQNRARVYIVGILRSAGSQSEKFSFADIKKVQCPSVEEFLDPRKGRPAPDALPPTSQGHAHRNVKRLLKELTAEGYDPLREPFLIDLDSTEKFCTAKQDCSPCITRRRGNGHWISNRGRRTNKEEMMRLQGMKPENFDVVVTENQWGCLVGNSMSVNVLERIFVRLLPAAGLVPAGTKVVDRWEVAAKKAGRKFIDDVKPSLDTEEPETPKRGRKRPAEKDSLSPTKRSRKSIC